MDFKTKNWMSHVSDDKCLLELNIPGTHDCVTQYVQLSYFAKCQSKNIYEQLMCGARALDIRVESRGDNLKMVHGITKAFNTPSHFSRQMDLEDVLSHCYRFLSENKSEAIVFQFKNDSRKEEEHCFDLLFRNYISKNPSFWFCENRIPKMSEVRGRIFLIRRCNADFSSKAYEIDNSGLDFSSWEEQITAEPNALALKTGNKNADEFVIMDRFKYKPEPHWLQAVKPFFDGCDKFSGVYKINYLSTAGGLKGPERNAKYTNKEFMKYELSREKYYGCVYMDFINEDISRKIIETNFS